MKYFPLIPKTVKLLPFNIDTYIFDSREIKFLGHVIDKDGISPLQEKVETIHHSSILTPLTHHTRKENKTIAFQQDALEGFNITKTALTEYMKLSYIQNNTKSQLHHRYS